MSAVAVGRIVGSQRIGVAAEASAREMRIVNLDTGQVSPPVSLGVGLANGMVDVDPESIMALEAIRIWEEAEGSTNEEPQPEEDEELPSTP